MPPREHVEFLAASPNRVALLRLLRDDPRRPSSLTDEGSFSRSTVHRNLDGFVERDWVRKDGPRYALTTVGRRVLDKYESLLATVDVVHEHRPLFTHLGEAAADLPVAAVDDATVVTATAGNPHAPLSHYADELAEIDSERFLGVSPIVSEVFNEASRRFVASGTEMELVVDAATLETARSECPDALDRARRAENFSLLVADDVSVGLALFDRRVFVGAYDDGGLRALVDGENRPLREWAKDHYESVRADAEPVDGEA